jgi:hypothetical protein
MKKQIKSTDQETLDLTVELPQRVKNWTPEQVEKVIQWYVKNKTLKQMRVYQTLNYEQTTMAYHANKREASEDLQLLADIYMEAVNRITS